MVVYNPHEFRPIKGKITNDTDEYPKKKVALEHISIIGYTTGIRKEAEIQVERVGLFTVAAGQVRALQKGPGCGSPPRLE